MHDCMRLSGIFFMLTIGGGSAEIKHLLNSGRESAQFGEGRKRQNAVDKEMAITYHTIQQHHTHIHELDALLLSDRVLPSGVNMSIRD